MFGNFVTPQPGSNPLPNLLFDSVGATPRGGFSLRKLTNSWSGPCLRIRRATSDTYKTIYFQDDGTLDTQAIINFCNTENGFVQTWYDQSGENDHMIQNTIAAQPKIYDSGTGIITQSGKPAVYFDGSQDWMFAGDGAGGGAKTFGLPPMYSIVVLRYTETGTNGGIVTGKAQFSDASQAIDANTSNKYDIDDSLFPLQSTTSVGTYDIVSASWNFITYPGQKRLWVNGVLEGTASYNFTTNSNGINSMGVTRYNDGNHGQMFLQEWVFWDFYATDANNTTYSTLVNNYYSAY